jgi:hypothetical protein
VVWVSRQEVWVRGQLKVLSVERCSWYKPTRRVEDCGCPQGAGQTDVIMVGRCHQGPHTAALSSTTQDKGKGSGALRLGDAETAQVPSSVSTSGPQPGKVIVK